MKFPSTLKQITGGLRHGYGFSSLKNYNSRIRHFGIGARCLTTSTNGNGNAKVTQPTASQLRVLALYSAVPMIGFGFMDNIIMIQVGDLIDNSIGVTFGLASITAAACGQIASDTSGVLFGGVVEAGCTKLGLPVPDLSKEQRQTRAAKLTATLSAALGVITGCLLGMCSLFFMDTHASERAKLAQQLESLFVMVMEQGRMQFGADRASLWLYDADEGKLQTMVFDTPLTDSNDGTSDEKNVVQLSDSQGIVGRVARTGEYTVSSDVSSDPSFDPTVDSKTGYKTISMLCYPVKDDAGKVVAVIQFINKQGGFTGTDVQLVAMLSRHIHLFMSAMES